MSMRTAFHLIALLSLLMAIATLNVARAERVKDLATVAGVRSNPLIGYGLVVGLDGTGDQTSQAPFTVQSLKAMLAQLGVTVPPGVNPQLKNVAAVAINAELPPFAKPGQTIDITVSSIANSGSLRGGTLLMAPLKGADGQVYAIAQGNVVVGGLGVSAKDGSRVTINVPSAGRVPGGATVERAVPATFGASPELRLDLRTSDFTTATRLATGINSALGSELARAIDPVTVSVVAPADANARVAFLSQLENLDITPGDAPARVIVNSRTGTVVISSAVRVLPAAVSHGSLSVTISEKPEVSQPEAFSKGQTVVVPRSQIEVTSSGRPAFVFDGGANLDDIVRAINQVGAAPGDLVAILEALRAAGALRAELVII
ncbi:flagellar basal body P-ring protein FlgI [Nevskia ramosa]|uniref:flagellar basal body P-ring protein FlgI n=1 Tax=Nevskia ramosa TaxID=64002 RepID=UPI0003B47822|nr:flagellar basal body P-ring protein FlgI [Nevskia ramosa]